MAWTFFPLKASSKHQSKSRTEIQISTLFPKLSSKVLLYNSKLVLPSKSKLWETARFHEVRVNLKRLLLQNDDEIYDDDEVDEDELSEYSADDYSEKDDEPNDTDDSTDESDETTVCFRLIRLR
jgi:hypothetical protein